MPTTAPRTLEYATPHRRRLVDQLRATLARVPLWIFALVLSGMTAAAVEVIDARRSLAQPWDDMVVAGLFLAALVLPPAVRQVDLAAAVMLVAVAAVGAFVGVANVTRVPLTPLGSELAALIASALVAAGGYAAVSRERGVTAWPWLVAGVLAVAALVSVLSSVLAPFDPLVKVFGRHEPVSDVVRTVAFAGATWVWIPMSFAIVRRPSGRCRIAAGAGVGAAIAFGVAWHAQLLYAIAARSLDRGGPLPRDHAVALLASRGSPSDVRALRSQLVRVDWQHVRPYSFDDRDIVTALARHDGAWVKAYFLHRLRYRPDVALTSSAYTIREGLPPDDRHTYAAELLLLVREAPSSALVRFVDVFHDNFPPAAAMELLRYTILRRDLPSLDDYGLNFQQLPVPYSRVPVLDARNWLQPPSSAALARYAEQLSDFADGLPPPAAGVLPPDVAAEVERTVRALAAYFKARAELVGSPAGEDAVDGLNFNAPGTDGLERDVARYVADVRRVVRAGSSPTTADSVRGAP